MDPNTRGPTELGLYGPDGVLYGLPMDLGNKVATLDTSNSSPKPLAYGDHLLLAIVISRLTIDGEPSQE
jgi:hypothetical protein